jgi:hypothetical protein
LLGDGFLNRREWVEDRIAELAQIFAVGVGGFSVMSNHVFREGKAGISAKLAGSFDRLGSRAEDWQARMKKLRKGRFYGRFFAASRAKLREMAEQLKVRHLVNLTGCTVPCRP